MRPDRFTQKMQEALSAAADFHCYGFVPNAGTMSIDAEQKSYIYTVQFTAHCMARDNA